MPDAFAAANASTLSLQYEQTTFAEEEEVDLADTLTLVFWQVKAVEGILPARHLKLS
jgi:hypothetical protein